MAKLYFRYGAMGSSKTANAIMVHYNYEERGQKALLLKPRLDTRDGDKVIKSRSGLERPCEFVESLPDIDLTQYACLIVDEAQFLTREQVEMLVQEAAWLDLNTILRKLPNVTPDEYQAIIEANEDEDMARMQVQQIGEQVEGE